MRQPEVAQQRHFWRYVRNSANFIKILIFELTDFKFEFWAEIGMGRDSFLLPRAFRVNNGAVRPTGPKPRKLISAKNLT